MASFQSSHSLSSPSSALSPQPAKKKRPAQLPLPSSNFSATPAQRLQAISTSSHRSGIAEIKPANALNAHARSTSTFGGHKPSISTHTAFREHPTSSPPTVTTFQIPSIPSTTHAGGILPSASFFHPSRPNRTSSEMSVNEVLPTFVSAPDQIQLAPLTHQISHESDDIGSVGGPASTGDLHRQLSKRMKRSREPLLPMTSRNVVVNIAPLRPSLQRDTSQRSVVRSDSHHSTNPPAGHRVRSSLERIFRGMSIDSVRKSGSSPGHTLDVRVSSTEERHTVFDGRTTVEDVFPSQLKYKPSSSPPMTRTLSVSPSRPQTAMSETRQRVFISAPPTEPSCSEVPLSPRARRYKQHPSRNTFFCGGHLLTGGDSPWAFIASLIAAFGISGAWFGTTCVWWWHNESPAVAAVGAYMCLLTLSSMFATAFRDPGILPRNLDPDPPLPSTSPSDGGVRAPLPRDLKVRNDTVRVKYCATCKTYRPPRSSHCKMCDNCVDGCDHHCQWVNNCVGRRNYTSFFVFLFSSVITLSLIICTAAIHIYLVTRREHVDFKEALSKGTGAGSAVVFILSIVVILPVTALLGYHVRLLSLNVTTIEQIRNQAHKTLVPGVAPPNPFSYGSWRYNLAELLCHPAGFSWLDGSGVATVDKRQVNPGLEEAAVGLGLGWEGDDTERAAEC
ncbi:hypothetical protein SERLA73DRAFT_113091 [Serpula lacrymans var. lacrymans S7.3]|uniref:Palmitoyltransferase n=1 Tax=Serpula lacrymans var. lacrymans (strain S7.3) TaxID=936435 RepID=F8Q7H0_SERL3|nr:hypothetical protein SERLA73DRAFT_113091 [Serpula lacrymans var. lacrymans S7.3]